MEKCEHFYSQCPMENTRMKNIRSSSLPTYVKKAYTSQQSENDSGRGCGQRLVLSLMGEP